MNSKSLILAGLALLLARTPVFADEELGLFARSIGNSTSNQFHLLDPNEQLLAQASPGAGNQKTSSAPAEPNMAELAKKANNITPPRN